MLNSLYLAQLKPLQYNCRGSYSPMIIILFMSVFYACIFPSACPTTASSLHRNPGSYHPYIQVSRSADAQDNHIPAGHSPLQFQLCCKSLHWLSHRILCRSASRLFVLPQMVLLPVLHIMRIFA